MFNQKVKYNYEKIQNKDQKKKKKKETSDKNY